jgi:hypothetical protein
MSEAISGYFRQTPTHVAPLMRATISRSEREYVAPDPPENPPWIKLSR